MKQINKPSLLQEYIRQYHIQDIFSFDISGVVKLFSFQRGEFLLELGVPSEYLYFLTSGNIQIYTYTVSEKMYIKDYYKGSAPVVGEAAVLWGNLPTSTVQALTDGTCVGISVKQYREELLNDNVFLRYVCQTLSERLRSSNHITPMDPVEVRFGAFLISNSENGIFSFNLSTCATLLNTSYRHLFRVINKLCDVGILKRVDNGYQILDEAALVQLANGKAMLDSHN